MGDNVFADRRGDPLLFNHVTTSRPRPAILLCRRLVAHNYRATRDKYNFPYDFVYFLIAKPIKIVIEPAQTTKFLKKTVRTVGMRKATLEVPQQRHLIAGLCNRT